MASKEKLPPKITESEMKDALLRSGYLIEHRAEQLLRHKLWYVFSNTAYPDPTTGKSRELDVSAMQFDALDPEDGKPKAILITWMYIECVNNPQPITLFPTSRVDPDDSSAIRFFADPSELTSVKDGVESRSVSIRSLLAFRDFHHYCESLISTQYASFAQKRDGTWMAWHEEQHNDNFKALTDMVRYKFDKLGQDKRPKSDSIPVVVMIYPILLLQGELVRISETPSGKLDLKLVNHGCYVRSVIHDGREEEIQIDIVP